MYNKILIAVAPDHPETTAELLKVARALCAEGGKIAALSVVEAMPTYIEAEIPTSIYEKSAQDAEDRLRKELADAGDVEVHVEIGAPAHTIEQMQKSGAFDLIVIRSHRPALRDWVLGTTANRIIRDAPCSVHVIR